MFTNKDFILTETIVMEMHNFMLYKNRVFIEQLSLCSIFLENRHLMVFYFSQITHIYMIKNSVPALLKC